MQRVIRKKRDSNQEIEKIMCDSLIIDQSNKDKIWKKSILGEWKSLDVFEASTSNFYEGMEISDKKKYATEFFKTATVKIFWVKRYGSG